MKRLAYMMPGLLAVAITVLSGAMAGTLSNRWGVPPGLQAAGESLTRVDDTFGDWEMVSSSRAEAEVERMLQCAGSSVRVYANRRTGQTVSVALLVGPPGPISVHTPEICFTSRDFSQLAPRQAEKIKRRNSEDSAFWEVVFRKNDLRADQMHVAYGWNAGEGWQAPSEPRFTYGGRPLLYKIQVAATVAGDRTQETADPAIDFLREFLPVLDEELVFVSSS